MKHLYILFLLTSCLSFAQITQVKDIWTGVGNSSSPVNLFDFSGTLLFRANDGTNGVELWKSDGTDAGTVLIKNINAGTTVSGTSNPANFTTFSGQVLFTASNGTDVNATELWKTDGTNAGTVLLKDINATAVNASGNPQNFTIINPTTMLFSASDGIGGNELWKTDGTTAGTVNVIDYPGSANSITWMENLNGTGILGQIVATTGREIYKSDGTGANSGLVLDTNTTGTTGGVGTTFFKSGTVVYFGGNSGTTGTELWKTDGTTVGTVLVKDINAGTTASSPGRFAAIGSTVYFRATGANGAELWKTDGTAAGTVEVADIFSGTGSSNPDQVTSANGAIYFFAADSAADSNDLYKYDGTTLTKLADFNAASGTLTSNFVLLGTKIYFAADSNSDALRELWQTDGTPAGTISVSSLQIPAVNPIGVSNITAVGGKLYFTGALTDGTELFKYEPVLSVSNANFAESLQVYPNPTNGKMYLNLKSSESVHYQIFDLLGKSVSEGNVDNNEINFEGEKGVYLLKLESVGRSTTQKIIKN